MLSIHATRIDVNTSRENDLQCVVVDYASITAAEIHDSKFQGCTFPPEFAVSLQPAEDMVIPLFICALHFNSFTMGLNEGVGIDEDLLD